MQTGYVLLPSGDAELRSDIPDDVDLHPIKFPRISSDPRVQRRYEAMRFEGESHNMAEMLAMRRFPGIKSDSIFNEGKFSGDSGKIGVEEKWLREQAEAAGVSVNGKWYCKGLASFPGDPTAWVGDRGDMLRIAREKNLNIVAGYVTHKAHEVVPMADVEIAPDLIDREVDEIMAENLFADREAVADEVYRVRTGKVDNNALVVHDEGVGELPSVHV